MYSLYRYDEIRNEINLMRETHLFYNNVNTLLDVHSQTLSFNILD